MCDGYRLGCIICPSRHPVVLFANLVHDTLARSLQCRPVINSHKPTLNNNSGGSSKSRVLSHSTRQRQRPVCLHLLPDPEYRWRVRVLGHQI